MGHTKEELAHRYVTDHEDSSIRRMYGHHYQTFIAGFEANSHDDLLKRNKELLEALTKLVFADELNPVEVHKAQRDAMQAINNNKS